jgi:hypothetical protein
MDGHDGDVLVCASVGTADEVVAVWTAPEGLGAVTSTTVAAEGAYFRIRSRPGQWTRASRCRP